MSEKSSGENQVHPGSDSVDRDSQAHAGQSGESAAEYSAATESVALFDLSDRTTIEIRGSDRQTFLNNFVTNDVKRLSPGEGCEAFLTNIKGRILSHVMISATDDALWLDSDPGTGGFIVGHLDKYIITEDVEITDRSSDFSPFLLTGPDAESWLKSHVSGFTAPPLWGQAPGSVAGIEVMIRRAAFTAPPGFEIIPSAGDAAAFRQAMTDAGVPLAGSDVFEVLRIEAGFPRYGVDISEDNIAQEAGRTTQAISFTKGCYLGQEPIARLDALGHTNRELRRLQFTAGPAPEAGTPVQTPTGDPAGHITSAATNPATGRAIALAMLKRNALAPETELRAGGIEAKVLQPTASTT